MPERPRAVERALTAASSTGHARAMGEAEPEDAEHASGDHEDDDDEDDEERETDAPHSCPEHPDTEALGVCSRCGGFYCRDCLASAGRPLDGSRCAKCPPEVPKARPIGGWLVLPAIQLVVNGFQMLRRCVEDVQAMVSGAYAGLMLLFVVELLVATFVLGLTLFAGFHFFRKTKRTINLMLGFYLAGILLTVFDIGTAVYLEAQLGVPQPSAPLLGGFVGPAIWIAYFTNSKRVRETFVRE